MKPTKAELDYLVRRRAAIARVIARQEFERERQSLDRAWRFFDRYGAVRTMEQQRELYWFINA